MTMIAQAQRKLAGQQQAGGPRQVSLRVATRAGAGVAQHQQLGGTASEMSDALPVRLCCGLLCRMPPGDGLAPVSADPQRLDDAKAKDRNDDCVTSLVERGPAPHGEWQGLMVGTERVPQIPLLEGPPGAPGLGPRGPDGCGTVRP